MREHSREVSFDFGGPLRYEGVYQQRRRATGWQLYEAVGVQRGDRAASARQALENYRFFGAPHVAVITTDANQAVYGAVDAGLYVANFPLNALGRRDECPPPTLNLVGDYGGGSMLLLAGVLAAVWHAQRTGRGQVVDAAMVDGVVSLSQKVWSLLAQDRWADEREANFIDGAAPFYRTYRCADGRFMAVGAIEATFYAQMLRGLGLAEEPLPDRSDKAAWPALAARLEQAFLTRPRDGWAKVFAELDACATPVLSWGEAPHHPQIAERGSVAHAHGAYQAAPAPRFSATPTRLPEPLQDPVPVDAVIADWVSGRG